jgi:hypothetical protein
MLRLSRRLFAAGLGLALLSSPFAWAAEVDRDLPDDTEAVLVINVRQVLQSPVVQTFVRQQQGNAEADDGGLLGPFDPEGLKDLERVTLAVPGGEGVERRGVAILRGRFDLARVNALAEAFAQSDVITLKIHTYQKIRFYEIFRDDPPTPVLCSVFLDQHTLVLSPSKEAIRAAIAKRVGRKTPQLNQDLEALINKEDPKQGIWLAGKVPQQFKQLLAHRPQLKPFAGKLEAFRGGVRFTDDIKAGLFLRMSDVQSAVDLRQTLEVSKSVVALVINTSVPMKEQAGVLTDILNSLKFTQDKSTLGVQLTVESSQIRRAFDKKPAP